MMAYTLDDLEKAKERLQRAIERADNSNRNNIDFGQADIRSAEDIVEIIAAEFKRTGQLAKTPKEILDDELDRQFPDARSKQLVEYKSKKYQRVFYPARKSRSGKSVTK